VIALLHSEYDVQVRKAYRYGVLVIDRPGEVIMDSIDLSKGTSNSVLKGMSSAVEFVQMEKMVREVRKTTAAIQPWPNEGTPEYDNDVKKFDSVFSAQLTPVLYDAARKYGDKYSFAVTLGGNRTAVSPQSLQGLYNLMSPVMQASPPGKEIIAYLNGLKNGVLGAMVTDFSLPAPVGKDISLSELKGKYVLIDFWASWCGPCRQSFPYLKSLYGKYNKHSFEILSISIDKNKAQWEKAVQEEKLPWRQVWDTKNIALEGFAVTAIPTTYLIGLDGRIIGKEVGLEENSAIAKQLEQLFSGK
jgi:thiol-disulfide isomerase/thioredoxin